MNQESLDNSNLNPALSESSATDLVQQNVFGGKSQTKVPLSVPMDSELSTTFNRDLPYIKATGQEQVAPKPNAPGFGLFSEFGHLFGTESEIGLVNRLRTRQDSFPNPLQKPGAPNWTPTTNTENLIGVAPENQPYVLAAQNNFEQVQRQAIALKQQDEDENITNGSLLGKIIGYPAALTVGSPSNLIPIAHSLRYADIAQNFIEGAFKAAPGMAASSAIYEGAKQSRIDAGNLKDYVTNVYADTVFASMFAGILGTAGASVFMNKLWQSRKMLAPQFDGIEFNPEMGANGEIKGLRAFDPTGTASAAKVDFAQGMADAAMSKNGLFSIPYLGQGVSKFLGIINPGIEGLNSTFASIRAFTDRVFSHGIITPGIEAGNAAPTKFDDVMSQLDASNIMLSDQFRGAHAMINGVDPNESAVNRGIANAKYTKDKFTKPEGFITEAEFSQRIRNVLISDTPDANNIINDMAKSYRAETDKLWDKFLDVYEMPKIGTSSRFARGYFMRIYNTAYLETASGRNAWLSVMSDYLKSSDEAIVTRMQPVRDAEANYKAEKVRHDEFLQSENLTDKQIKESSRRIDVAKRKLKMARESLQNELRTNEEHHINLSDDYNKHVSANEAKKINKIRKKSDQAKKLLDAHQKQLDEAISIAKQTEFDLFTATEARRKAKTKETKAKYDAKISEARTNLKHQKSHQSILEYEKVHLETNYQNEEQKIQDDLYSGKIDNNLWYHEVAPGEPNKRILKNPKERLRFRETYASDAERRLDAEASLQSILNQTSEETVNEIFSKVMGHGNPNMTKRRSMIAPDTLLHENNFLSSNVASNLMLYRKSLGRKIALKQVFNDVTVHGGVDELAQSLHSEFNSRMNSLIKRTGEIKEELKALDERLKTKELTKKEYDEKQKVLKDELKPIQKSSQELNKQFDTAKKYMSNVYEKMMGRTGFTKGKATTSRKVVRGLLSLTQAAFLGWVPFTQMSDLFGLVFKHGLFPFIRDGLLPFFSTYNGLRNTVEAAAYRENAGHVGLAFQHTMNSYLDKNWLGDMQPDIPSQKWYSGDSIVHGLEYVAHQTSNLAGTNYIDNFLQRVSANIIQSKIIGAMQKFEEGTLTAKELQGLLLYGIDPKVWSKRFLAGWDEQGKQGNGYGGFLSNYYKWSDTEASTKMGETIFKGVRDSVLVRKGMLDSPFWMDNMTASLMFQFKGYMFNSITRYVTPLMQNPDTEKLLGTMLMVAAGSLQYSMRDMAHGKEINTDPEYMLFHGLEESGVGAFGMQLVEYANVVADGQLLKGVQNQRFANITKLGAVGGPVIGIARTLQRLIMDSAQGNTNKTDLKHTATLIPFLGPWYLQMLSGKVIDTLNIPKTRSEAKAQKGAQ